MKRTLTWILIAALFPGCAWNAAHFRETGVTADGLPVTTEYSQQHVATMGSKVTGAEGDMSYSWDAAGGGNLAVGNASSELQAGEGTEALSALVQMVNLLVPVLQQYVQAQAAAQAAAAATGTP